MSSERNNMNEKETSFNKFNAINLLAYIFNVVVTFGVGTFGWVGNGTNGELSAKYQTILTPSGTAFSIWGLIFIVQAIWCILQLFPSQRNASQILQVHYKYLIVSLLQAGWTFSFSYEVIWLSLIFMLSLLGALNWIVLTVLTETRRQYFLYLFPFTVHCGWIYAASALNINVVLVRYGASAQAQVVMAGVCLAGLLMVAMLFLFRRQDFTIPCVLAWALGWVYNELQDPIDMIVETFSQQQIDGIAYASIAGVGIILVALVGKLGLSLVFRAKTETKQEATPEGPIVVGDDQA